LHTNQNTKHPTSFVKKTSGKHSLPHELCSLKFLYLQVFAFFIKLDFLAGVQMLFGLHYTVCKSTLCHQINETMSIAESSEILQNFMHPNRV